MKRLLILAVILFAASGIVSSSEYFKNKYYPDDIHWNEAETEHFRIIYVKGREALLPVTAQFAEDAYDFNSDNFKIDVTGKIFIIVYPTPQLFTQTQLVPYILPPNIGGFATFKDDRVVVPFNGDVTYFRELLYHEISHIFQYHKFFKNPLAGLTAVSVKMPTWVFEGLSEHATENWSNPKFMILKDAVLNGYIHNRKYFDTSSGIDYLGYQEAHSLIDYLLETGSERDFERFLKDLNISLDADLSLKNIYGTDLDTLYVRWRAYLTEKMNGWAAKRPSLLGDSITMYPAGTLKVFSKGKFYIVVDKNRVVRKIMGDDDYCEVLFAPGPFTMLMASPLLTALNKDETRLAFIHYENAEYRISVYDFITRHISHEPLQGVSELKKLYFEGDALFVLAKRGTKSMLTEIRQGTPPREIELPYDEADDIVGDETQRLCLSTVGGETYIHAAAGTLNLEGTLIQAQSYTSDSIFLLLTRDSDNIICHYNLKTGRVTDFPAYRETITGFDFIDGGMLAEVFWNAERRPILIDMPDYDGESALTDIYQSPRLADSLYYEEDDFKGGKFNDPLRFNGFLYGFSISENKYLKLNTGFMLDSILNETQLVAYVGYFTGGSKELDFAIAYRKTGNRPSYGASFIKDSYHRNDDVYTSSFLSGDITYPFSLTDSLKASGGVRFTGFKDDKTVSEFYGGLAYIRDTAYGRIYPDYGMRLYLYAGGSGDGGFSPEAEADLRFYGMPFMSRLYFRHSKAVYLDDNYIRGYRDTYFAAENKYILNLEIRTPLITTIPGFYRSFTLPPISAFVFGDAGLFTDDTGSAVILDGRRLADPKASIGFGVTIHLSSSMSLDTSFAYKTDLEITEKKPVVEFSVNRLFY